MKTKILAIIFLIVSLMANISLASYSTVTMEVVEEPVCTINLSQNAKFEKKLISKDLKNKEVTLQLKITNDEIAEKPTGEIMLVIDNSNSMTEPVGDAIRKDIVFDSAKNLVSNLLKDNTQLKIGIVSFSTNADQSKEATIEDATLESTLSDNITTLTNAITNISANGARTNLESGLSLASQQFTKTENNKYIIVLTDGVPNVAINYDNIYYSDDVISKTKQQMTSIESKGINLITMLTGINDEDKIPATTTKTKKQIIDEIFGTETAPTAGKFYYITDEEITDTINSIYNSLLPVEKNFKNIKIIDYFPSEIIDNFDFSYVEKNNIGEISTSVDKTNNSITWTIPELKIGQTGTVQYKLKLKEDFNSEIVGKILDTNKKVDITYTDFDNKEQSKTSDVTPKLKLTEPKVEPPVVEKPKVEKLPVELPKAGAPAVIGFILLSVGTLIFSFIKIKKLNKMI